MKVASALIRRLTAVAVAGMLLVPVVPFTGGMAQAAGSAGTHRKDSHDYAGYLAGHEGTAAFIEPLTLTAGQAVPAGARLENGRLLINDGEGAAWRFETPTDGWYAIQVKYGALKRSSRTTYEAAWRIDGAEPFQEADGIRLPKLYVNEAAGVQSDDFGNQQTPRQVEIDCSQERYLQDYSGYYDAPYRFYFSAGEHELAVEFESGGIALESLTLCAEPVSAPYAEALAGWLAEGYEPVKRQGAALLVQGEDAVLKTDTVLYPRYDNTSASTMPSDPSKIVLNTIGGQNWCYPGQSITWTFQALETGLYRVAVRARQNMKRGVEVSRRIRVNGEVPCEELENVRFDFDAKWYVKTLEGDAGDLYIPLKKGDNTIELEVVPSYSAVVRELNAVVLALNDFYRSVIMITGTAPDTYQDYNLDKNMNGYRETLQGLLSQLDGFMENMESQGFHKGGESEVVGRLRVQLESFLKEPSEVPFRMSAFQSNIAGMASWIQTLSEQPLEIDWIQLLTEGEAPQKANAGFLESAGFIFRRLLASFTNDYSAFGSDREGDESIDVWLNLGRDQAQVVKRLTDDDFVPAFGGQVNVKLVQQSLIPATLAGTGPDVAIFVDINDEVNLAARGALTDLSRYPDFDSLRSRFQATSLIPYTYMDGIYGLPVSESFFVTFYRKDVLAELGLEAPDTWDAFYDVLKVLQRNHLQAGIPPGELFFKNLLYQHGGTYYKDGWKTTGFDEREALDALTQWTELYTKYSLPTDFDFYSRFRTGEMPIGVAEYTFQNQLSVAAPEIQGLWGVAPVPGLRRADGSISRAVVGNTSAILLFGKAADKETGWNYLKWFTSASVQEQYAKEIEALMGPAARHPSATVEAMASLPWDREMKTVLLEQWSQLQMVEQTPVNYYVSRHINNIFRNIVYYNKNPREVLSSYNRDINREISRRRLEFHLDT